MGEKKKGLFQKVGSTRIIPISMKIVTIFTCLLLLSNFATNFINLILSQRQVITLNNEIMVSKLKDLYSSATNQFQIFLFNGNKSESVNSMKAIAKKSFSLPSSLAVAVKPDGSLIFSVCNDGTEIDEDQIKEYMALSVGGVNTASADGSPSVDPMMSENSSPSVDFSAQDNSSQSDGTLPGENLSAQGEGGAPSVDSALSANSSTSVDSSVSENPSFDYSFYDKDALALMNANYEAGISDGSISFSMPSGAYFGVYKYHDDWKCYFICAELRSDTTRSTNFVFGIISLVILILLAGFLFVGLTVLNKILSNVNRITNSLYEMQQNQKLETIDLSSSPNDDITYLAVSFNSLSSTISNLLGIFQKFVSKDVVAKAYTDHQILLEGKRRNLTILFSDIRSFTYRTETLGNEIIDLLNVHYNKVIHVVHENSGVIGSIIGDAILAIYGTVRAGSSEKSMEALSSAWEITRVTAELRNKMIARRSEIEKKRELTEAEINVFNAVLIDVGVGIDGGNVFYGNIGSDEHMTNTVIGDNVNSASRLEGLTRIYRLPVIVSDYIKEEVEAKSEKYKFFEVDTVQVKGKTEGKKIYFPLEKENAEEGLEEKFAQFEGGLSLYYEGKWSEARKEFKKCDLDVAQVFLERIKNSSAPAEWNGIWTMTTK